MKRPIFIIIILLQELIAFCQSFNTANVHPLFTGERLNGDKVREAFDNFEPAFLTGKPKVPTTKEVAGIKWFTGYSR